MKKFLALTLALVLAFAVVACGAAVTSTKFKVDIFYYNFEYPYIASVRDAMTEIFDAEDDIDY